MIPPYFFGLPIFAHLNLVMIFGLIFLIFKIFLADRHSSTSAISVCKNILALRNIIVAFKLPENCPAIVTATGEECAYDIPSYTINRLFMIAKLRELSRTFKLFFVIKLLHLFDIKVKRLLLLSLLAFILYY